MKSLQFRSIAPKAPVLSPGPGLLSCQPPSALPDASSSSPKSIIVPAQNYALMQIAGKDGTFSLVALPPGVSPQQQQQPVQPLQKNLKLPIPRYQPMRSKCIAEKVMLPLPPARVKAGSTVAVMTQTRISSIKKPSEHQDTKEMLASKVKVELSEQVILIDPAASEISVAAMLPENAVLYPRLERAAGAAEQPAAAGLVQNLQFPVAAVNSSAGRVQDEGDKALPRPCQSKPAAAHHPGSITVLSPAIFSKAVQLIPSPPRGKLPILPYSKMKSTLFQAAKLGTLSPEKKCFSGQPGLASPLDPPAAVFPEAAEALSHTPAVPNALLPPQAKATLLPVLGTLQKPPGKKRGRKRKTMDDILAFEARKKRFMSFLRRRVPEKPPAVVVAAGGSKQEEVDISKKYRSIRPKPTLVMETVPHLVSLPAITSDVTQDQELLLGRRLSVGPPVLAAPAAFHQRSVFAGSRALHHRCSTCGRCFQFKHHLQSHASSHTDSRPHACPVCRKAYAHSGSLSAHMKLHHHHHRHHHHHHNHRPRKTLRCEFCEKAFGYAGVYFCHLREVHRVLLTVEPSIRQHEEDVHDEGAISPVPSDEEREDPVELQIKCGRCQAVTPTFADMKLHLLYVHGEEVRARPRAGREAEDELVKHAAHYWQQLNERRNLVKCGSCDEEFLSFSTLKRHILSHHRGGGVEEEEEEEEDDDDDDDDDDGGSWDGTGGLGVLEAGSAFNCVLCSEVLDAKAAVMEHWRRRHHCEQPSLLWDALSSYSGHGEFGEEEGMDTPASSPH